MNKNIREEQFGFTKGVGTRDAIRLLRTIGERYVEMNRMIFVISIDPETALDRVKSNKLMEILQRNGID